MNITHYLVSALSRKEVYHFLDTHPWAYPLGALLLAFLVAFVVLLRIANNLTKKNNRKTRSVSRTVENVSVLARPTTAKGKGHWVWQEDSQRTSGD